MLEFDKECRRLLKDIHYFDVLRSDRSISSNGLEARTPFLDRNFVQTYLSIPYHFRCHSSNKLCEKYLLRKTFDDGITLPDEILWRTKEAFSDGVSNDKEAWFETINKFIKSTIFSNDSNYPEKEEDIINMMIKEKILLIIYLLLWNNYIIDCYLKNIFQIKVKLFLIFGCLIMEIPKMLVQEHWIYTKK